MHRTEIKRLLASAGIVFLGAGSALAAKREELALDHVQVRLPGAPASILPADLDGDGRRDLVVVLAYNEIESIGEDRIEGMVQITRVVPAVADRREVRAYLRSADGGYHEAGAPFPLPPTVLAIAGGVPGQPLVALTDEGLAALRFDPVLAPPLVLEPLVADPPLLAGSGRFFSDLEWLADLDGDGRQDVLLPARDGVALYHATAEGLERTARQRLRLPGDRQWVGSQASRVYTLPRVEDVDGDRRPDLIVEEREWNSQQASGFHLLLGREDGSFGPAHREAACERAGTLVPTALDDLIHIGDLDGDGRAEAVTLTEVESGKDGMFAELKEAKRPHHKLALYRLDDAFAPVTEPYGRFEVTGYAGAQLGEQATAVFRDLDADGRKDLVTITLDFSLFQALKVMATKRISIGIDFHVWAQDEQGTFREVQGLDLSEKLKFDLGDLRLERMAQFAGDFDGDKRIDFVHLGRGSKVTIHRGRPGCAYPAKPDLVLELDAAPDDLGLVRVADLDGDGRADLGITRPLPPERPDLAPPVLLDLYLSGGR